MRRIVFARATVATLRPRRSITLGPQTDGQVLPLLFASGAGSANRVPLGTTVAGGMLVVVFYAVRGSLARVARVAAARGGTAGAEGSEA